MISLIVILHFLQSILLVLSKLMTVQFYTLEQKVTHSVGSCVSTTFTLNRRSKVQSYLIIIIICR